MAARGAREPRLLAPDGDPEPPAAVDVTMERAQDVLDPAQIAGRRRARVEGRVAHLDADVLRDRSAGEADVLVHALTIRSGRARRTSTRIRTSHRVPAAGTIAVAALLAAGPGCGQESEGPPFAAGGGHQGGNVGTASRPDAGRRREEATRVRVFFLRGEQLAVVERSVAPAVALGPTDAMLRAALDGLLAGPRGAEAATGVRTVIPAGTRLRRVRVSRDGRTAIIRLNGDFARGIRFPVPGLRMRREDKDELTARLALVAYTVRAAEAGAVTRATVSAGGRRVGRVKVRDYLRPQAPPRIRTPKPQPGPRPDDPRSVQEALVRLRYLPRDAVSGTYDYRTQQAVLAFQAWEGMTRDGAVGKGTARALIRARPPRPKDQPAAGGGSVSAEVYRDRGVALLARDGELVRAVHISSGAGGATPAGHFTVQSKALMSWSVPFKTWLPYASYFVGGIALHAYPDVPAYPASHGCVRVSAPEAPFVYQFLPVGSPVTVF